jgi:phosphoglucomutase
VHVVLLNWLLVRKKWPGDVVRAFNTTGMMDRIAAKHGRKLYECNIGFKYIADLMMEHEILIGGEESGGIGYGRFLPERDGILNALLLANVMAEEKKPLGQLVADLQREFGAHYYGRRDLHISDEMKNSAIAARRRSADHQARRVFHSAQGESRRREVLSRRSPAWQRRRRLGFVSSLRHRKYAALLCGSLHARTGRRNSRNRRAIRAAGVTGDRVKSIEAKS